MNVTPLNSNFISDYELQRSVIRLAENTLADSKAPILAKISKIQLQAIKQSVYNKYEVTNLIDVKKYDICSIYLTTIARCVYNIYLRHILNNCIKYTKNYLEKVKFGQTVTFLKEQLYTAHLDTSPQCLTFLFHKILQAKALKKTLRISKGPDNPFSKGLLINKEGQVFLSFPEEKPRAGANKKVKKCYFIDPNTQTDSVLARITTQFIGEGIYEAQAMDLLKDIPGVQPLVSHFAYQNKRGVDKYVMFQPYRNTDLFSFLENKENIPEETLKKIAQKILETLAQLEIEGTHRDIKPGNILLDDGNNPFLADFESYKNHEILSELDGTYEYLSPELAKAHSAIRRDLTGNERKKGDVWALGVVFLELFCKKAPPWFQVKNPIKYIKTLNHDSIDEMLEDNWIKPLLKQMLEVDPEKRLTAAQALDIFKRLLA